MPRFIQSTFLAVLTASLSAHPLEEGFRSPPERDRPAVYGFFFARGDYGERAITLDMEAMKRQGISTCLLYSLGPGAVAYRKGAKLVYGETENRVVPTREYDGPGIIPVKQGAPVSVIWSEKWMRSVRHMAEESARLGIELGISMGGVGCDLGGLPDSLAEQVLVHGVTNIKGGAKAPKLNLPNAVAMAKDGKTPRHYRDIAVLAVPAAGTIQLKDLLDLTLNLRPDGTLDWTPPAGDWTLLRFGHSVSPKAQVIDHLSREALDEKWRVTMRPLIAMLGAAERKALLFAQCDSYEGGKQTWTPRFGEEFFNRRGYDLLSWLPALTGRVVGDEERTRRFLRDHALTISDLYVDNHYARHTELARAAGLRFFAEAAGPHQFQTDTLKCLSRCDVAMGEFWIPGTHRGTGDAARFLLRDSAAAAQGYGKTHVFCEAYTGGNDPWQETPFRMKSTGDQAFCDGLTRPCLHGYNFTPSVSDRPGMSYWAGVFMNRNTTWWPHARPFFDTISRTAFLQRHGLAVADVAFFTAEGIGKHVPRKAAWQEGSVNGGPALGGRFDFCRVNSEILLERMEARDGRLALPDGMEFRLLALDSTEPLRNEVLRKLAELVEAGAILHGTPFPEPYGLRDDPEDFRRLVSRLWGTERPDGQGDRRLGRGRVLWGIPVVQALERLGVAPAFEARGVSPKGVIDWVQRKIGDTDSYFVCSRWLPEEKIEAVFRVDGKIPEFWDPMTGEIREATAFRRENGRIIVPIVFAPCGSMHVIFRKATSERARAPAHAPPARESLLEGAWEVDFDPAWFYPAPAHLTGTGVLFPALQDWTTLEEPAIRYFSGRAVYRKSFEGNAPTGDERVYLDLGCVHETADVKLNGRDLGVVWKPPYRVEITPAMRNGTNELEIGVINLWPNRLIGDTFLPAEQRRTRTPITKYTQSTEPYPSGLLGPVMLQKKGQALKPSS